VVTAQAPNPSYNLRQARTCRAALVELIAGALAWAIGGDLVRPLNHSVRRTSSLPISSREMVAPSRGMSSVFQPSFQVQRSLDLPHRVLTSGRGRKGQSCGMIAVCPALSRLRRAQVNPCSARRSTRTSTRAKRPRPTLHRSRIAGAIAGSSVARTAPSLSPIRGVCVERSTGTVPSFWARGLLSRQLANASESVAAVVPRLSHGASSPW
jgi:hypothetical protein